MELEVAPCWMCFLVRAQGGAAAGFWTNVFDFGHTDLAANSREYPAGWVCGCSDFPGCSFCRTASGLEWASTPSPLCQKLGDAVALDPVWQGEKPVDAVDLDLRILASGSELGKSVFLVLLLDANAEFVAEPSDGQGGVACASTMFGILDVGAWQPDHGVSWVDGSTIRGTWVEVRGCAHGSVHSARWQSVFHLPRHMSKPIRLA